MTLLMEIDDTPCANNVAQMRTLILDQDKVVHLRSHVVCDLLERAIVYQDGRA